MIKEIKKKRSLLLIYNIINDCYVNPKSVGGYCFLDKERTKYYNIFKINNNKIEVCYHFFITLGMNPDITEEELKSIIHERFITSNKI